MNPFIAVALAWKLLPIVEMVAWCYGGKGIMLSDEQRDAYRREARNAIAGALPSLEESFRERLIAYLNARESSALVQSETAAPGGTLRWVAAGRAEAYRDLLDHLAALLDREAEQS